MSTITITKKKGADKRVTLKAATRRMSWSKYYEYAFDQGSSTGLLQAAFPATMEYVLDDGDEIVEVDADGQEIDRYVYD